MNGRRTASTLIRTPNGTGSRHAIVRASVEAFARYGYRKTTLQDVAARVGLTRTGLLHHFQSKDGLFLSAIAAGRDWAERESQESALTGGLEGLRAQRRFLRDDDAIFVRFVHTLQAEALHEDAPPHVVAFASDRFSQIRVHVARCLEEAIASDEIREIDVPAVATLVAGAINGLQLEALLDDSLDTERAFDALLDLLLTVPAARSQRAARQVASVPPAG